MPHPTDKQKRCDVCESPVVHDNRGSILIYRPKPEGLTAFDLCGKCATELIEFLDNARNGSPLPQSSSNQGGPDPDDLD